MLLIVSDVETLDNRCADWAQLIHDDRVPLLPARRELGPRRSLNVSDLIGARHRPSRYRCTHRARRHSLAGVHNARPGAGALARPDHICILAAGSDTAGLQSSDLSSNHLWHTAPTLSRLRRGLNLRRNHAESVIE